MIGEDDLPDASTFDRPKRNLLIIDEINISDKHAAYKKKFGRLFNYCSTHCSLQPIYHHLPGARCICPPRVVVQTGNAPLGALKKPGSFATSTLGRRLGIKQLAGIFDDLALGPHGHVWIDLSGNGPKLRKKNLTHDITIND